MRKSLALRIVQESESTSAKLYVAETNNLKPERQQVIDEFATRANNLLHTLVTDAKFGGSLCSQLYEKCTLMLVGEDFLRESLDVIESKSKVCLFKFDDENDETKSKRSTSFKFDNSESKVKSKKPKEENSSSLTTKAAKFKGADIIFQRIKWDDNIDKKQVIIGYLDRFKGIKDIRFDDFKVSSFHAVLFHYNIFNRLSFFKGSS